MSTADEVRDLLHSAAPLEAAMATVEQGGDFDEHYEAIKAAADAEIGCKHLLIERHPCSLGKCVTCGATIRPGWEPPAPPAVEEGRGSSIPDPRPVLPPCPVAGCDGEHHWHTRGGEVVETLHDDGHYEDDSEGTRCYSRRIPDLTTDLHTIDCRGMDPGAVQDTVDAIAAGIMEAIIVGVHTYADEGMRLYEDDTLPQPYDSGAIA